MDRHTNIEGKPRGVLDGLLLANFLAIALLVISIARLIADSDGTALNLDLAKSTLSEPIWHTQLGRNLGLFAGALTLLHLAFGSSCWLLAVLSERAFRVPHVTRRIWVLLWYIAGVVWILVANATLFPKSSLGQPYQSLINADIPGGLTPLEIASVATLAPIAYITISALHRITTRRIMVVAACAAAITTAVAMLLREHPSPLLDAQRPNIVILGVDSLRIDAINEKTPRLQEFMASAVQMSDAITPLARTFPSWASILTGRHPHTTGAYMNLLPREMISTGVTLPQLLRREQYRTYYAIDETRFSNIDESYGFDRVAAPPMGGSDFVLARVADTPLSNLVMNSAVGALMFPHVHANRAVAHVYDPDAFVWRVSRELDTDAPVFLAAHMTLPHWPYTWSRSQTDQHRSPINELYEHSVQRTDQQFGDLLDMLERRGILDNAIVVVLSDHGESLGHSDEFLLDHSSHRHFSGLEFQRWGHGTSVFSPKQYQVVLAFRAFGVAKPRLVTARVRSEPVSLLDIAPTLVDLLDLQADEQFDGVSLTGLLEPGSSPEEEFFTNRIRFTESEYNPHGFDPREFTRSQLAAAAKVYELDPVTDRITVRPELLPSIMASRQYAALLGNRVLAAAVPDVRGASRFSFIHVARDGTTLDPADERRLESSLRQRFDLDRTRSPDH